MKSCHLVSLGEKELSLCPPKRNASQILPRAHNGLLLDKPRAYSCSNTDLMLNTQAPNVQALQQCFSEMQQFTSVHSMFSPRSTLNLNDTLKFHRNPAFLMYSCQAFWDLPTNHVIKRSIASREIAIKCNNALLNLIESYKGHKENRITFLKKSNISDFFHSLSRLCNTMSHHPNFSLTCFNH